MLKPIYRLIPLFLMTLSLSNSNAQEWKTSNMPRFRTVNGIIALPGYKVVAVGGNESNDAITGVYRSVDTTKTWDIVVDQVASPWLTAVCFTSELTGYACGNGGKFMITADGGASWTAKNLPGSAASRNFKSIYFPVKDTGYLAGGNKSNDSIQTILRTVNAGADWIIVLDRPGPWLRSVYFLNGKEGFVCGDQGTLMHTADGGSSWDTIVLPPNMKQRQFNKITFYDAQQGFIVGGHSSNDSLQTLLATSNGGKDWTIVIDAPGPMFNDIQFTGNGLGHIVGNHGVILTSNNAGAAWQPESLPDTVNDARNLNTVCFFDKFFGVVAGDQGKVLTYLDRSAQLPYVSNISLHLLSEGKVKLDAMVQPNGYPTMVFVRYGTTMAVDSVYSFSDLLTGSSPLPVSVTLTGLPSSQLLYLKFVCGNEVGVTESVMHTLYAGYDIPNWSFEQWDTLLTITLSQWKTAGVVSRVDNGNGNYAASCRANAQGPGVFIYGDYNGSGFIGGVPFAAYPDSVVLKVKYSIAEGDSAGALIYLKKNSAILYNTLFKFRGNSSGNYERLAFKIGGDHAVIPDSLILGIISTDFFNGRLDSTSTLTLDSIWFTGTDIDVPNAGFSTWRTDRHLTPSGWLVSDQGLKNETRYSTEPSTTSYKGKYALRLSQTGMGENYIATGQTSYFGPSFPVKARHNDLCLLLQFYPDGEDTLFINLNLFKNGIQVGSGYTKIDTAVKAYTPCFIPVNYTDPSVVPDSGALSILIHGPQDQSDTSYALIDAITFDTQSDLIRSVSALQTLVVYPNPADESLTIQLNDQGDKLYRVELYDLAGRLAWSGQALNTGINSYHVSLNGLSAGQYLGIVRTMDNGHPLAVFKLSKI